MIHETAIVSARAWIHKGAIINPFTQISAGADIGEGTVIGHNCFIGKNVHIGAGCKIQGNCYIPTGVVIKKNVFIGPSVVFTNVKNPRADTKKEYEQTIVGPGVTIGASTTIICGIFIGNYAFIAAGAVVAKNVPDYALMAGVPARCIGVVDKKGVVQ